MTDVLTGDPLGWRLARQVATAVAIGVFDGVHRGHRSVLEPLIALAVDRGLAVAALTFDPHPLEVVAPERAPLLLSTVGQRISALAEVGAEIVGVLPFEQVRTMEPDVFARDVIGGHLNARVVAVGADFRFGRDRQGDVETLRRVGGSVGYEVLVVDLVDDNGTAPISSTRIRSLISEGDVESAAGLLGHPYELCGIVVEGDRRGRTIGFPTANLAVEERLAVPADGVYAAWAVVHDDFHPAVVNIGVRPTFDGVRRTIEAHLLDFDGDLYGKGVALRFVARLRGERRFDSIDALIDQITHDVAAGRAALTVAT
ncbi:MAG: bifunctional riboflavin kinase/FAD synthetase [Acidimicrobiia bacterium]